MEGYTLRDLLKIHWKTRHKKQDIYFVLLSNQQVIIDTEWDAMKRARFTGKQVVEMMLLKDRKKAEPKILSLNKLLEDNDNKNKKEIECAGGNQQG